MPSIKELQPWLQPYAAFLLRVAEYNRLNPTITSVYRSEQKQSVLYQRYLQCKKSGAKCIPAAPPGASQHGQRLAFDLVVGQGMHSAQQRALGELWRRMGGRWGGEVDPVHFAI